MNEQHHFDDSYISLSAFLCLGENKETHFIQPSHHLTKSNAVLRNTGTLQNDCDSESAMENRPKSKIGKQKKEKKQYSKSYRVRHKEFVENLKNQNQKYQKQIQELTLKIEAMNQEIKCLKYGKQINDKLFDTPFLMKKEQILNELAKEVKKQEETAWQKVQQFCNFYGFAGTEKINLLNYYMSQIIDNLLIDQMKNFILNGLENFQTTKSFANEIYKKEQEIIGCAPSNFNMMLKYLKKYMPENIKKFHKSGQDFYQSYVNLINEARQIEDHISTIKDGVHRLLPADKYIGVLKWYEQNRYCKQLQLLRKEWFESFLRK